MSSALHIIYVPGLGDTYDRGRALALKTWKRRGVKVTFVPMKWRSTSDNYIDKLQRVKDAIYESTADRIVLVGESAGGAIVTVAGYQCHDKVSKVITIYGKNVKTHRVSPYLYRKNEAFKPAMLESDKTVDRMKPHHAKKHVVFYSPFDPTVRLIDTAIPGAEIKRLFTPGHLLSILLVLTVFQSIVIREAKRPI
jgi:pimeloyl-ACP methyl ester carboxylesterase